MANSTLIEEAKELIAAATNITVLTGAGISTDSGIPDYRGPNGIWTKDPQAELDSNIDYFRASRDARIRSWKTLAENSYHPNGGHDAIATLAGRCKIQAVITQNVDGLHSRGHAHGYIPNHKLIEIHGSDRTVSCIDKCGFSIRIGWLTEAIRAGAEDPRCPKCGSFLRRDVVYFGEDINPELWDAAEAAIKKSDLFLIVGTSLQVWPVANLPTIAYDKGIPIIIVNGGPTGADDIATVKLNGDISTILSSII